MRAAVKIAERYASVEPLPLVPATWIELYVERWGLPKWERSRAIRPSERSIAIAEEEELRGFIYSTGYELRC